VDDDQKLIHYYLSGYPRSSHNNQIYRNNRLFNNPEEYFGENFYLVGDCAFENTKAMVTSYKKVAGQTLHEHKEGFNTYVGRLCISFEHTIGMLKGRFQFLQLIPMVIHKPLPYSIMC
jgi:DDE superfamily endonuclease